MQVRVYELVYLNWKLNYFCNLYQAKDDEKESKELMGDKIQNQIDAMAFKNNKLEKTVNDLRDRVEVRELIFSCLKIIWLYINFVDSSHSKLFDYISIL